ncbi:MAG: di-trans,poly-cis-decaprenylcistransferase [Leptospiraceae bacterium]|nr:di-trans,poly-cis-decaprenylcistransferase [Leptospiraceae bacterium]
MKENHIAFIMDGNGRWAQSRGMSRTRGHAAGVRSLEAIVQWSVDQSVPYLSFYAFSTENWKRPAREIRSIFRLMDTFFRRRIHTLIEKNVRILVSGDWMALPEASRNVAADTMRRTAHCTGTTVNLCINYGGQMELRRACALWAAQCQQTGDFSVPDEEEMRDLLYSGLPDVDLLIRTGGDSRISNFLLYQLAYAELFFLPVAWPDLRPEHVQKVLQQFAGRERRMGGLAPV